MEEDDAVEISSSSETSDSGQDSDDLKEESISESESEEEDLDFKAAEGDDEPPASSPPLVTDQKSQNVDALLRYFNFPMFVHLFQSNLCPRVLY